MRLRMINVGIHLLNSFKYIVGLMVYSLDEHNYIHYGNMLKTVATPMFTCNHVDLGIWTIRKNA